MCDYDKTMKTNQSFLTQIKEVLGKDSYNINELTSLMSEVLIGLKEELEFFNSKIAKVCEGLASKIDEVAEKVESKGNEVVDKVESKGNEVEEKVESNCNEVKELFKSGNRSLKSKLNDNCVIN